MGRLLMMLLLFVWFCGTYQQNSIGNSKIREIYGIAPTEKPDNSCECLDELIAAGARKCVCVRHYLCTDGISVDRNGRGIIDIRADEDAPCSLLEWCCSLENVTSTPTIPDDKESPGCGWRKPNGVGFGLAGKSDEAEFGEFPWMVAVLSYIEESVDGMGSIISYQCGGTLIHPQAVITGAHCVDDKKKKYIIRAGEWDSKSTDEIYPSQDRNVKSVIIHPHFYKGALLNNVAFLLLDSPVNMTTPNVGVACLPQQDEIFSHGTHCLATGWGKDKFGQKGKYQVVLKKVDLPIVERGICEQNLRQTRLGKYFQLHTSFICAGGERGKDMCKGDGGGPLVCPIPGAKDRYKYAGIISWGIGCGDTGNPGVYANVALFRDWIDQQAINNNLDTSIYTY